MNWIRWLWRLLSPTALVALALQRVAEPYIARLIDLSGVTDPSHIDYTISALAAIFASDFFQKCLLVLAAFGVGGWLNLRLELIENRRAYRQLRLGEDCLNLSRQIGNVLADWHYREDGYQSLQAPVEAFRHTLSKSGFASPVLSQFKTEKQFYIAFSNYLNSVGTLLKAGHTSEAKKRLLA